RVAAAEHNGTALSEQLTAESVLAANHCILNPAANAPAESVARLNWLKAQLAAAQPPQTAGELLTMLGQIPSEGSLRVAVVVDAARGDLLVDCGAIRERVHIGALLPSAPAGNPDARPAHAQPTPPAARQTNPPPASAPTSADLQPPAAV